MTGHPIRLPLVGGCQCDQIRDVVTAVPKAVYAYHCTQRRSQSASTFGLSMPVPRDVIELLRASPTHWRRVTASGRVVTCASCPTCGTRVYHLPERAPGNLNVKAGSLDDTRWLKAAAYIWLGNAQLWVPVPSTALRYDKQPADFTPIIDAWNDSLGRAGGLTPRAGCRAVTAGRGERNPDAAGPGGTRTRCSRGPNRNFHSINCTMENTR